MKLMKQSDITEACVRILKQWNTRAGAIVFSEIPKARGHWLSHARDVSAGAWLQWGCSGMKGRQHKGLSLLWYGQMKSLYSSFKILCKHIFNSFSLLLKSGRLLLPHSLSRNSGANTAWLRKKGQRTSRMADSSSP